MSTGPVQHSPQKCWRCRGRRCMPSRTFRLPGVLSACSRAAAAMPPGGRTATVGQTRPAGRSVASLHATGLLRRWWPRPTLPPPTSPRPPSQATPLEPHSLPGHQFPGRLVRPRSDGCGSQATKSNGKPSRRRVLDKSSTGSDPAASTAAAASGAIVRPGHKVGEVVAALFRTHQVF